MGMSLIMKKTLYKKHLKLVFIKILAIFFISPLIYASDNSYCFTSITDLHLNPNLKSAMPILPTGMGTDLDKQTYQNMRQAIISLNKKLKPDSVLLLGDMVGHGLKPNERVDVIKQVVDDMATLAEPTYFVFGNNDSPQGNYQPFDGENGSTYKIIKSNLPEATSGFSTKANLQNCHQGRDYPCLINEDPNVGLFTIELKQGLWLVSLNSVLMNGDYIWGYQGDAQYALKWLNEQLTLSAQANAQVVIAMHVPPAINLYSHQYHLRDKFSLEPIFQNQFITALRGMINLRPNVLAILSGHTHHDEVHLIKGIRTTIPIIIAPALSTSHGNAPGLSNVCFKKKTNHWQLQKIASYKYMDSKQGFSQYYSLQKDLCEGQDLQSCFASLVARPLQLMKFVKKYYYAENPNQLSKEDINQSELIISGKHERLKSNKLWIKK